MGTVNWVKDFYSRTGTWWGPAEARITDRDHHRVAQIATHAGPGPHRLLELGAGYGTTAVAAARAGHHVTAVEISDRVRYTADLAGDTPLTVVNDDFHQVRLDGPFDVVGYFDGFGVGTDDDQARLLTRIARDWLAPGGVALIDIYNPFVWASWHNDEEHRTPAPADGYAYELHERVTYDPVTNTATDTWWEPAHPGRAISQHLRCYTPADLRLLLRGTGLQLTATPHDGDLLTDAYKWLAVLTRP